MRKLYKDNEARKKRAYFQKEHSLLSFVRKGSVYQHLFLCLSFTIILNHSQINRLMILMELMLMVLILVKLFLMNLIFQLLWMK